MSKVIWLTSKNGLVNEVPFDAKVKIDSQFQGANDLVYMDDLGRNSDNLPQTLGSGRRQHRDPWAILNDRCGMAADTKR